MSIDTEFGQSNASGSKQQGDLSQSGIDEAKRVTHAARERVVHQADERVNAVAERLDSFASTLERTVSDQRSFEGDLVRKAAGYMRRASDGLHGKSTDELLDTAKRQLREHPGLMTAGLVTIGFLGGRLFRR